MFNVRVPLPQSGDVFLMNTFTDAQILATPDVVSLLDRLGAGQPVGATTDERDALAQLSEHGFVVADRAAERQALEAFFRDVRESTDQLRVTVLTTLQCNFACDYCIQGDHGDYNKQAAKMSLETAARVGGWVEGRLDVLRPESFVLTFFGGEPLLNQPVMYYLAERLWAVCQARGVRMLINVITNGLLLTRGMVERLNACGLNGVKITLDGDRDTHNRMRPLRGGQGTFDKIIQNVREVADLTKVSVGGNFDMDTADSYPALLDFLREQEFADKLSRVSFKPVIREKQAVNKGLIPLTAVSGEGKPLNGACMTSAGTGVSRVCDLQLRRREDGLSPRRDEEARVRDGGRRPHGPVRNPQGARPHHRPRGLALRVPGICRRSAPVDRPHRRPAGRLPQPRPAAVRAAVGVGAVRRLRVHPGLRRRLHRRVAQRARRHARAELP